MYQSWICDIRVISKTVKLDDTLVHVMGGLFLLHIAASELWVSLVYLIETLKLSKLVQTIKLWKLFIVGVRLLLCDPECLSTIKPLSDNKKNK